MVATGEAYRHRHQHHREQQDSVYICSGGLVLWWPLARHTDTATSTRENSRTECIPVVEVEYYGGQAERHRHQHHREQQDSVYTCSGG